MGALNVASMVHSSWSTQGLAQPGQGRQSPHGPHLPMDCGARQGTGPLCQGAPGQEDWGLGQGSLGSCWLPAVPHQPCLPTPSLIQLERKAGTVWGPHRTCLASTYMEEGSLSQRHQDVLGATGGHGRQGRGQDLGAVLRALQTKHRKESNKMVQSPHAPIDTPVSPGCQQPP